MATKILIPTPLRPFTGKQDAVELDGATIGELLAEPDDEVRRAEAAPVQRTGQAAQLRQRLRERRRHPVSREGADAGQAGRHGQHHPVGRRRRRRPQTLAPSVAGRLPELTNDEVQRYSRHLIMPEVGVEGQQQAEGGAACCASARAASARRRRCISPRPASARSASSISTSSTSATCSGRSFTARRTSGGSKLAVGEGSAARAQPARRRRDLRDGADRRRTRSSCSSRYDVIVDGTDNFPDALSRERRVRAARQAERLRQHLPLRGTGVGVRARRTARATAACIPSRRRPAWCRAAPKAACWACCRASSACIQATEAIKLILGIGEPLVGRLLIFDALRMNFRELKLRKDPDCPVCGTHPTVTELIDYEQFCGVAPAAAGGRVASNRAARPRSRSLELKRATRSRRADLFVLDVREPQRIPDLPDPGLDADSARRTAAALRRARRDTRDRRATARSGVRSAQGGRLPARSTGSRT